MDQQSYRTPAGEAGDSITIKKSQFIGRIAPASSPEEAMAFVERVRGELRDARHHVFAYDLRCQNGQRCSDDGEPQGTGGKPTLEVLQKGGITDAVIVVSRIFGGILLGAGGLLRAYSKAASLAVAAADIVTVCACRQVVVALPYDFYPIVENLLPNYPLRQEGCDFLEQVTLRLTVRADAAEGLCADLVERSGGRVTPRLGEVVFSHL
ncbi:MULTISPECIES: IMPACT family protein [Eubacteriales]|uniref:Uncharacterized protein, YigZ family n=1 Tax=Bittarella massiliensis (ex Durand et al. 2017) TaxID=1720313 RepID=A0AAQ1MFD0_9FIRM|nr:MULTISPECIES: YigZ family protein [Eubacteriales]ERJ00731.1 YigZ family protein [Clostridium sp. ATCC 29733]SHG45555.1 uncharacterized protein, YigZ family [Bittarella massiliensis (ex Durand et al. 2017)]